MNGIPPACEACKNRWYKEEAGEDLETIVLNEATGALAYARHYYGSQTFPEAVKNLLGRLEKIRLAALK